MVSPAPDRDRGCGSSQEPGRLRSGPERLPTDGFPNGGCLRVPQRPSGRDLGPDVARRQAVRRALNGLLSQKRTWTAAQLSEALSAKELIMQTAHRAQVPAADGARYVRTTYVLRHALPPGHGLPRVVVLDNASTHRSQTIRDAGEELAARGIALRYLPPYSPELNDIERTFRRAKHEAMHKLLTVLNAVSGDQVPWQTEPLSTVIPT